VNPDLVIHKRSIYNVLDLLGDVGGLQEALKTIGALIILLFGQNGVLQSYLISRIYYSQDQQ